MSRNTFEDAAAKAIQFRDDREWKPFHNPKDLAISVSLKPRSSSSFSSGPERTLKPPGRSLRWRKNSRTS